MWLNAGEVTYHSDIDEMPYYQRSLALAKSQLEVNPDEASVLSALALTNAALGDAGAANKFITLALSAGGNDVYVMYDVAVAYARMGL